MVAVALFNELLKGRLKERGDAVGVITIGNLTCLAEYVQHLMRQVAELRRIQFSCVVGSPGEFHEPFQRKAIGAQQIFLEPRHRYRVGHREIRRQMGGIKTRDLSGRVDADRMHPRPHFWRTAQCLNAPRQL